MSLKDVVWMAGILAGTGALLYRSFRRPGGACASCDVEACTLKSLCRKINSA